MTKANFLTSEEFVVFRSNQPLKTLSSAVHNAGMGWYRTFVNRHVDGTYNCDDVKSEMATYLEAKDFPLTETVAMMTAVPIEHAEVGEYEGDFGKYS